MVKAGSQLLGIKAMMRDFGIVREGRPVRLKIVTDASAAKGISQRNGLGQVRHIEVNMLWLQDKVRSGDIAIEKVGGGES